MGTYFIPAVRIHDLSEAIERLTAWSQTWQLHLASNKCFLFTVKNSKIYPCDHTYTLASSILSHVDFIRDLGVTVDSNLKFDKHISLITHKALVRSRLILKCFHSHDRSLLVLAFCTYVRPLLEYCCAVWSPHHHNLIDKIEGVQRFFTKRLVGLAHEPYNIRLFLLNLESLEYRRLVQDLILCYKVYHGLVDSELNNALPRAVCTITKGHISKLQKVSCRIDATKYFFTNRINDVWNQLPSAVVDAESIDLFRKRLRDINFSEHLRYPCLPAV